MSNAYTEGDVQRTIVLQSLDGGLTWVPVEDPVGGGGPGGGLTDAQLRASPVPVSGPLTDAQLRASAVPISGSVSTTGLTDTELRATPVAVSGTVTASGPLTDAQLRATPVPVSGTVTASGPLTDAQLRAVAVPVSGPLTDAQLRATAVPVSGPLTDAELRATPVPISGTVTASGPLTDAQLRAASVPVTAAQATAANLNTRPDTGGATASAVPARAVYVGGTDGTNLRGVLLGSAANLTAATTQAALLAAPFAQWSIMHRPAANTKATATKAAGGASVRHVVTGFAATWAAGGTAHGAVNIDVIDGASGGATRLASGTAVAAINGNGQWVVSPCCLIGTANTALTIEFSAAGGATTLQTVALWGYSTS